MNSTERHEARYQRRKQKRLQKKAQSMAAADNFDAVFTFDNLYHSYKKCCLGVGWKASTQRYRVNAIVNVNDTLRQLKEGKFKSRGFYTFIRIERGKERNIKSVHISERVVQRCLCDYSLIPILSRSFIYDNSLPSTALCATCNVIIENTAKTGTRLCLIFQSILTTSSTNH